MYLLLLGRAHNLLRSVKDLDCSKEKKLSTVAYFARIYIPPLFKIAVFGPPVLGLHYHCIIPSIPTSRHVPFKDMRRSIT